jgi:hypothetical protein
MVVVVVVTSLKPSHRGQVHPVHVHVTGWLVVWVASDSFSDLIREGDGNVRTDEDQIRGSQDGK